MALHNEDQFNADPPAGFDGQFEWDFLIGALGGRIKPMDLDAIVERRNWFLVFETKRHNTPIPHGQRLTLEALVRLGRFTIVIVWGKKEGDLKRVEVWTRKGKFGPFSATNRDVFEIVDAWFKWADSGGLLGYWPRCLRLNKRG